MTGAWFMTSLTLVGAPRTVAASRSSALAYSAATRSAGCTAYQPPVGGAPGAYGEPAGGRAVPVRGSEPGDGRVGRIAVPAVGNGSDNPAVSDLVVRPSRVTTASASGYADVDVQCAPGKVRAIDLVNQAPVRTGDGRQARHAGADEALQLGCVRGRRLECGQCGAGGGGDVPRENGLLVLDRAKSALKSTDDDGYTSPRGP